MTAFVDTNVLIRHLTGDPPDLAARATAFLAGADELLLPDLIVAEIVYVLESYYEVPTDEVARLVRSVIAFAPIRTLDPALLLRSLSARPSRTHTITSCGPWRAQLLLPPRLPLRSGRCHGGR